MATAFFDLSTLDGTNGFVINGPATQYGFGRSPSWLGDINGDGIDDVIIGADHIQSGGISLPGFAYVVLGRTNGFAASLNLASLDGSNGFVIQGVFANDSTGFSVSGIDDINGDGLTDLLVGARFSNVNGSLSGRSYVVFGQRGMFPAVLNLADLNGSNGFSINGIGPNDRSGRAVSRAGDINGDGLADFVIGASLAKPGDDNTGQSYVVFGSRNGFPATFDLTSLNGTNGFAIDGFSPRDDFGFSVSTAGDTNGDGLDDLIVGAISADPENKESAGQSYVIFGQPSGFSSRFSPTTLDGTNGFIINGLNPGDLLSQSVRSAGDVNGDGLDDIVIGAPQADPNGKEAAGQSYVIFGQRGSFSKTLDLSTLNGSNGFTLNGAAAGDQFGIVVNTAGDLNNDGIDDLVFGAPKADPDGKNNAGQVYVVYGSRNFAAVINVANLSGDEGLIINGKTAGAEFGRFLSKAGDLNKDSIDDLIIGAPAASPNGLDSGQAHVIFGGSTFKNIAGSLGLTLAPPLIDASGVTVAPIIVDLANTSLTVQAAQPFTQTVRGYTDVIGTVFNDRITGNDRPNLLSGNAGDDAIFAGAKDDTLIGGAGNDRLEGGTENDRYLFDADTPLGIDTLSDSSGVDTLDFSQTTTQSITLNLSSAKLQVLNSNHRLKLSPPKFENAIGTGLADSLTGNAASNSLVGNGGNDRLIGGAGKDRLSGGAGRDRLIFDLGSRFNSKTMGVDIITDFTRSKDKLVLDRTTFSTLNKGRLKRFEKVKTIAQAKTSDEQIVYIRKTGSLFYNTNGDKAGFGQGGLFADLKNGLNLTVRDFVIQA